MQRNAEKDLETSRTVEENLLKRLAEIESHYTAYAYLLRMIIFHADLQSSIAVR